MNRTLEHDQSADRSSHRSTGIEQAIGAVAKRASATNAAAGIALDGSGGDGGTAWTTSHRQGARYGLHALEEAHARTRAGRRSRSSRVFGVDCSNRAG